MDAKKTYIDTYIAYGRLNDADYIRHLENTLEKIQHDVNEFINLMDKSLMAEGQSARLTTTYVNNIHLIQFMGINKGGRP